MATDWAAEARPVPRAPATSSWLERLQRDGGSVAVLLALWGAYSLARIALLPWLGPDMGDPDNYMRLLEVRDLLAGQSWFDVHQYAMNPPFGADMHWSRLVDLPLALTIGGLGLVLPMPVAETAGTVLVPLLWLLATLAALRLVLLRLGLPPIAVFAGLAATALFPLLLQTFAPFSIDHHGPQAAFALGCAAALLHAPSRKAALAGGALAAAWMVISLEGLVLVAALAAVYGLRYLVLRDRSLAWFLGALAVAAPVLSFATRPVSEFAALRCDILLSGHMAGFAVAALGFAALSHAPRQDRPFGRFVALAVPGLASAAIAYATVGQCLAGPFAGLDPLVKTYWYDYVREGLPIWRQLVSVQIMLVWTALLVPAGWWIASREGLLAGERRAVWATHTAFALAAAMGSLLLMRTALVAQLLAVPFAAVLIVHFLPRARALRSVLPRALATVACLTLATPALPSALGKPFDPVISGHGIWARALALRQPGICNAGDLAALPPGLVFAPLDMGPKIVALTGRPVVISGYHRNQAAMKRVIDGFSGDPAQARQTIEATGADYLVLCGSNMDISLYRTRRPDSLANALLEGQVPGWLTPVPLGGAGSALRVYRIERR